MSGTPSPNLPPLTKPETFDLFAQHVSSGKAAFFQAAGIDFVMGRREGPYLWDLDGATRLINCHCNGGVYNLGHRHPALVQTLIESLQTLDIGNHHLVSAPRAALAARLAELTGLPYTVFAVGGGEAIDLAIKVARAATGRQKIVSASGGYHGHTGYALHTGDDKYFAPFGPRLPGFVQVPFGDAEALTATLPMGGDTAAVILETVPATLGMPIPPPGYLEQARQLCDQHGALLILDEIQAGLGRTGRLWAFQHFAAQPDILVIGKGLSGGLYPMAATCLSARCEAVFHADPFIHISTFGGAEVGCPLALQVLNLSSEPVFLQHVQELAAQFAAGFAALQARHPQVLVRLRQLGLMMGIEMAHPACGPLFSKAAYDHGFLSVYAYNDTRMAQFLPPLIIDQALADELLARVDAALGQVAAMMANSR
jgi:acetylornithine/succinyldiaminopimelate/putrescine aminotransferase